MVDFEKDEEDFYEKDFWKRLIFREENSCEILLFEKFLRKPPLEGYLPGVFSHKKYANKTLGKDSYTIRKPSGSTPPLRRTILGVAKTFKGGIPSK